MIKDNYEQVRDEIARITATNGIGQPVSLVAVTKYQPSEVFPALEQAGVQDFAENRVQALTERAPLMTGRKHLIGHLQTNKAKQAVRLADLIQSVDSLHLAETLQDCACRQGKVQDILIQVNIAKEPQKFGIFAEDLDSLLESVSACSALRIRGLMAIMPIETKEEYYLRMYEIYRSYVDTPRYGIHMEILSMGMSNDYLTAVKYGSNMVRIGRRLFL